MPAEKTKFTTVEKYIDSFPENIQFLLEVIRETIKESAPDAEEVISYNIPAFKFHGMLIFYSAYKNHITISIPPSKVYEVFKAELSAYKVSKSAIQLPLNKQLPLKLIKEMTEFRLKENLELAEEKKRKGKAIKASA
ncbi:Uncharacterized conserved protein YdhG, YjbR/CyaY-like superfamily, DUF1801 family [Pedobacter sp. ok626]|uniref:iron chaperone n=1 Tax=Pedobacter sp. ok626 TaxID=1761882 RepID=UPI00088194F3|nr:DUF1801 domain-containing protein [Pedobacter sp. ok626]SDL46730.1 Uncharacterized conserved protein YdhG, YjbR/CyaY-like superfamily, DUF1801 family [Pedobacter sp. ok626]